jgi:hypothetical protein
MALAAFGAVAACAHATQFDRYYEQAQWSKAAKEFASDSSLHHNERELYRGVLLYSTPGRPTFSPDTARALLSTLLVRFPESPNRDDAVARLALLDQLVTSQRGAELRARDLEARIDALTRETRELRARADSSAAQSDSLRGAIRALEAERKEREEQLKALRLELQQLKEIDLKPKTRKPPR